MLKLNYLKQLKNKHKYFWKRKDRPHKVKDEFHDRRLRNESLKVEGSKKFDWILLGRKGKDHNFLRGLDEQGRERAETNLMSEVTLMKV